MTSGLVVIGKASAAKKPLHRIAASIVDTFKALGRHADGIVDGSRSQSFDVVTAADKFPVRSIVEAHLFEVFSAAFAEELSSTMTLASADVDKKSGDVEALQLLYAQSKAGELVTSVSDSQRASIRQAVVQGLKSNKDVPGLARDIRESIGLLPRQQRALDSFRASLVAAGEKTPQQIDASVEARRKTMINQRATTIARTEFQFAQNAGRFEEWKKAVSEGTLSKRMKKVWIGRDPCPICVELARLGPIGLTEQFYSLSARRGWQHPPAHPNCKCSVGLVRGQPLPPAPPAPPAPPKPAPPPKPPRPRRAPPAPKPPPPTPPPAPRPTPPKPAPVPPRPSGLPARPSGLTAPPVNAPPQSRRVVTPAFSSNIPMEDFTPDRVSVTTALERIAKGKQTADDVRLVRQTFQNMLKAYGLNTKTASNLMVGKMPGGTFAFNRTMWNEITMGQDVADALANAFTSSFAKTLSSRAEQTITLLASESRRLGYVIKDPFAAFQILIHEELHGTRKMVAYQGMGVFVEEMTVEFSARRISMDMARLSASSQRAYRKTFAGYKNWTDSVEHTVKDEMRMLSDINYNLPNGTKLDEEVVFKLITDASIAFRRSSSQLNELVDANKALSIWLDEFDFEGYGFNAQQSARLRSNLLQRLEKVSKNK